MSKVNRLSDHHPENIDLHPKYKRKPSMVTNNLKRQTKHKVRVYMKDGEPGVDFTNLETPRFADNAITTKVSDECMEKLKGDNWREEVENILKSNK